MERYPCICRRRLIVLLVLMAAASIQAQEKGRGKAPSQSAGVMPATGAAPPKTHLHLVFRLDQSGSAILIRAAEVEGEPLLAPSAGPFISEVSNGSEVVAVQAEIDPFEMRSFRGPEGSGLEGHHFQAAAEAEITVKVPDASLSRDLRRLSIRFFKREDGDLAQAVDTKVLDDLKQRGKVKQLSEIQGSLINEEIRRKFPPRQ